MGKRAKATKATIRLEVSITGRVTHATAMAAAGTMLDSLRAFAGNAGLDAGLRSLGVAFQQKEVH